MRVPFIKLIKKHLLLLLLGSLIQTCSVYASDCGQIGEGWTQAKLPIQKIEFCYPKQYLIQVENDDVFIVPKISSGHRQTFFSKNKLDLIFQGKRVLDPNDYVAHIKVGSGNLKTGYESERLFVRKNGVVHIRIGRIENPPPAKLISNVSWSGVESVVACSKSDEKGFHALAGECLWAVGSDTKHYFIFDTIGEHGTVDEEMEIIKSIRFISAYRK